MSESRDLHALARQRILLSRAGLLAESDEEWLQSHLGECSRCREYLESMMVGQEDVEDAGHIPPEQIAHWPEAQRFLRGLMRSLVRHHLERCAQCRQDIEMLGFEPVLPHVPELESAQESLESVPRRWEAPDTSKPAPVTLIKLAARRRPPWAAFGGWAAAAALLAVMLLRVPGGEVEQGGLPVPPVPGVSLEVVGEPVALRAPTRGQEPPSNTVVVPRGARAMTLRFDMLDVPDDAEVKVEILAGGRTVTYGTFRQRELYPRKGILVSTGADTLAAGDYVLRLTAKGEGIVTPEELDLAFRVEISR